MHLTTKGQVTIPIEIRIRLGLLPGTKVEFSVKGDGVVIRKARDQTRGRRLVARMRGRGDGTMTTDEIMALTRGDD